MPIIGIFCLVGAYILQYSLFDVLLMFCFGLGGYWLSKMQYPFAPLVLGIILGPMADENLRRTLDIYGNNLHVLLFRPIGLLLILGVAWSTYYSLKKSLK